MPFSRRQDFMRCEKPGVMVVTRRPLDGNEGGHVEDPEEAVVEEEGVLVEIVESNKDEHRQGPCDSVNFAAPPAGPERKPATKPTNCEKQETGDAKFERDLEKSIVSVGDDKVDSGGDLQGGPLHSAPEGVVTIAEQRSLPDEMCNLNPDCRASRKGDVPPEKWCDLVKPDDQTGSDCHCRKRNSYRQNQTIALIRLTSNRKQREQKQKSRLNGPGAARSTHEEEEKEECERSETAGSNEAAACVKQDYGGGEHHDPATGVLLGENALPVRGVTR